MIFTCLSWVEVFLWKMLTNKTKVFLRFCEKISDEKNKASPRQKLLEWSAWVPASIVVCFLSEQIFRDINSYKGNFSVKIESKYYRKICSSLYCFDLCIIIIIILVEEQAVKSCLCNKVLIPYLAHKVTLDPG